MFCNIKKGSAKFLPKRSLFFGKLSERINSTLALYGDNPHTSFFSNDKFNGMLLNLIFISLFILIIN